MSQKRMFDRAIIRTDNFVDMPPTSQNLYFHLGIEADDEGFVSPKMIMRSLGCGDDDLKILSAKGFIIPFKSGVIVITDWRQNNYLDVNRIKPTQHQEEKRQLLLTSNNKYELNKGLTSIVEYSIEESSIEQSRVVEAALNLNGDKELFDLLEAFKSVNPSYKQFNKTECDCLIRLVKEHGKDKVAELVSVLPKTNNMEFAPVITTPFQLEKKLGQLLAFIGKEKLKLDNKKIVKI